MIVTCVGVGTVMLADSDSVRALICNAYHNPDLVFYIGSPPPPVILQSQKTSTNKYHPMITPP